MTVHKYSIKISGHGTSISLETEFWHSLNDIALIKNIKIQQLIEEIDLTRQGNLSSAIRLYVLNYFKQKAYSNEV
jgi:predicted DNA-binding ribbon-helix-helix protein